MSDGHGFHGPKCWAVTFLAGLVVGWVISLLAPAHYDTHGATAASAPLAGPAHAESSGRGVELAQGADEESVPQGVLPGHDRPDGDSPPDLPAGDHAGSAAHGGAQGDDHHGPAPRIPIWLVAPFALLLASIALMPFINGKFWHHHFPDFAFLLGGTTLSYYLNAFHAEYSHGMSYGAYKMLHAGMEYYAFMALVGGLFVASGGILVKVRGRGTPLSNTVLLGFGAVLANVVGTTGASVLLIRPFMRMNAGRLSPLHIVFFIFAVSNCGGSLTPIGDPPLYLGFLQGVPFLWTTTHLFPEWATVILSLLALFFVIDTWIGPGADQGPRERLRFGLSGFGSMVGLGLIVLGVFIDPLLKPHGFEGIPVGPTFQVLVAAATYLLANKANLKANEFTFFPVKEVGLLFLGIFATMAPALAYLSAHGSELGIDSPTKFYFATGSLSAVLDNAPTYLNFLQVAFAAHGIPLNAENIHTFIATERGALELAAISLGSVFFGAMTYIGNGPNFMVKSIAEAGGVRMPSFFGYTRYAVIFLLPILVLAWGLWIR
ncbi:MAG: sodium:proton antiporter [Phycisphaerales bacterium]|nr:sodium:proton antiporter [Phycisphaerales bacterium]